MRNEKREFEATGVREALEILHRETAKGYDSRAFSLHTIFKRNAVQDDWFAFDQFVTSLEKNPCIKNLVIVNGVFYPPSAATSSPHHNVASDALERFFRVVLPSHCSLNAIILPCCQIKSEYVVMLATALAAATTTTTAVTTATVKDKVKTCAAFKNLSLRSTHIDRQGVAALASNILGLNAPTTLLDLVDCGIDSAGCQMLLEALDGNTFLKYLMLGHNDITDITLAGAKAISKCLRLKALDLNQNPLTSQGIQNLAQGLKTNFCLERLYLTPPKLSPQSPLSSTVFEELLAKFNFTLLRIVITWSHAEDDDDDDDADDDSNDEDIASVELDDTNEDDDSSEDDGNSGDDSSEGDDDSGDDREFDVNNSNENVNFPNNNNHDDEDEDDGDENEEAGEEGHVANDIQTSQQRIDSMIQRNRQVRITHVQLLIYCQPRYHVPHLTVWPLVLERIHCKPCLIYRFVRQANLNAFSNLPQLLLHHAGQLHGLGQHSRRRP